VGGRRLALVITVDRYDNPGLRELAAPAADAQGLADVLGDPDLGGFELEFLHNPTSWTTNEKVDGLLADRQPADLVLLHFSCHGLKDIDGELYLATTNTVPERLASTAVESAWINRVMQRSRAQRVVLLLDCCYGGAFERGVLVRGGGGIDVGDQFRPDHLGESRGRVVITASTAMEYAFEGSQISGGMATGPSVFTGALVDGIRTGQADRDRDGFVGLDELYDYVYDTVKHYSPQQTPCKWEFGLRGELYVARNPNRSVAPANLPQELLDLLDHPTPGARLAAVNELDVMAAGPNLARAAAARLALQELVEDDSRRVSASAIEALQHTAVHLPESAVSLECAHGDSTWFIAEVPVEGPPLALASAVATSGNGLRARVEAGSLRISWLAETGKLDGTVTLSGPAGEAHLRVTATLPDDRSPEASPPARGLQKSAGDEPNLRSVSGLRALADDLKRRVHAPLRSRNLARLSLALLISAPLLVLGWRAIAPDHEDTGRPRNSTTTSRAGSAPTIARQLVSLGKPIVVATIPTGREPEGVAVAPDSRTVYVTNQRSRTLSMIDVATLKLRNTVPLPHMPRFPVVSPDGTRIYVTMYDDDKSGSGVAAIDANTGKVLGSIATGPKPYALAVAPDGRLWVPIHDASRVEIVDGPTLKAVGQVTVPQNPHAVVIAPDGARAYTPDHESNMISIIDTQKRTVARNIAVGHSPHSIALTSDGHTILVGNYDDATVNIVDVATRHVSGTFRVGNKPQSVAFAHDGTHAYAINEADNSLSTLTSPAGRTTSTVLVGSSPRMIAIAPDGRFAYVTNGGAKSLSVIQIAQ
jgi:YVTN family beta-propeller protein